MYTNVKIAQDHTGQLLKSRLFSGRYGARLRTLKQQYARALLHLQAYAVLQTGVRISCQCTNRKGNKQRLFATKAGSNLRSNVSSVFGAKFMALCVNFARSPLMDQLQVWPARKCHIRPGFESRRRRGAVHKRSAILWASYRFYSNSSCNMRLGGSEMKHKPAFFINDIGSWGF